jgi:hypothetical protein
MTFPSRDLAQCRAHFVVVEKRLVITWFTK